MADQLVTPSELASFLQRSFDIYETATAILMIEMATAKVQAAAGQRLIAATSTFVIDVDMCHYGQYLALPQMPVRSVASVLIDGVTDTTWLLRSQRLWRRYGWNANPNAPTQVTAVATHGYPPGAQALELARDFTLALAGAGFSNPNAGAVQSEQIDDYRVTYAEADARMQLSDGMRDRLRSTYGVTAYVTG